MGIVGHFDRKLYTKTCYSSKSLWILIIFLVLCLSKNMLCLRLGKSSDKATINQSWKLSKANFWPNPHICQMMLHKTFKFGTFLQSIGFIFALKALTGFKVIANVKILKFEGDKSMLLGNVCAYRKSCAKYLLKTWKIKQSWTRLEKIDVWILNASIKNSFLKMGLDTKL